MLRNAELVHHVDFPNHVSFIFVLVRLLGEWTIILTIMEAFGVEACNLAAAGHIPKPISVDHRCTADALIRPVVDTSRGKLFAAVLPKELAVFIVEANENTQIHGGWVPLDITRAVVGANIGLAIGNHWIAIGFRTQRHGPTDVLACFHVELDRQWPGIRNVVPFWRPTPLRPIRRFHLELADTLGCNCGCIVRLLCQSHRGCGYQAHECQQQTSFGKVPTHAIIYLFESGIGNASMKYSKNRQGLEVGPQEGGGNSVWTD